MSFERGLLTGMEFDLFIPSFPELQQQFNISPFWVEALLSVNFIGFFLSLFVVANFADRYGRKPVILVGLTVFIVGSCLCLWANTYSMILIGRLLQGLGIAAPSILSFIIIAETYPLKQQQRLMAILNGLMNISAGLAPVLGSYITMYFHWQGNFVTLLLLGITTLTMTIFFIPAGARLKSTNTKSMDVYVAIFRSRPLVLLIIYFIFSSVPYWLFVGMSPLLFMKDLGVSLSEFGFYQGSFAFLFAIGSMYYGLIINKCDQEKMLYASKLTYIFSFIMIALVSLMNSLNPLYITLAFLPFVMGQIIPIIVLYPLCLNIIPQAKAQVSATMQGIRLVISALSLQLAGHYYTGSFQNIGIIMGVFMILAIISLYSVIRNQELIKFTSEKPL
jgi:MFS transporter, DHA1 family, multidrug resistance protein